MNRKYDIVTELANKRLVEQMVCKIAHQKLSPELRDLSQMVYVILLEYDEARIIDLYDNKQMHFFVARIIINQFRSSNSPFHIIYRKFQETSMDITGMDWEDE